MATREAASTSLPSLYVVCDADVCERAGWAVVDFAQACVDGGARLLQVRAKAWAARPLFDAVAAIVERTMGSDVQVIVNDRADVARLAGASGVHVGQEDLAPVPVRAVVGAQAVVGLSTHTVSQIEAARAEPITYLAVGPVFGTATKNTGYDAVGLDRVRYAVSRAGPALPVVAIGGITLSNSREVLAAGAASVAVISDLLVTGDPSARVREFLRAAAAG